MYATGNRKRRTTDLYTGRSFTWDNLVIVSGGDGVDVFVPARSSDGMWLHPDRVPARLLRELNPEEVEA
jgi:hypothetical protein